MQDKPVYGNVNRPPRNKCKRRAEQTRNRAGSSQPPQEAKVRKGVILSNRKGPTTLMMMTIIFAFHKKLGVLSPELLHAAQNTQV